MVTSNLRITVGAPLNAGVVGYLPVILGVVLLAPALERARALGGVAIADLAPQTLQSQALWVSAVFGALLAVGACARLEAALAEGGRQRRGTYRSTICWLVPTALVCGSLLAMNELGTPPQAPTYFAAATLSVHMGATARLGVAVRRGALVGSVTVLVFGWIVPSLGTALGWPLAALGLFQPTTLIGSPAAMLLASVATSCTYLGIAAIIEEQL